MRRRLPTSEAEERIRERERQLADAEALAQLGSWELRIGEERARWSDGLCRIAGCDAGFAPTIEEFISVIHADDRRRALEDIGAGLQGADGQTTYRLVRPSGEVRHVHARWRGRRDENGTLTHLCGAIQDVTDRRGPEVELRRQRDFSAIILRSMTEGFALTRGGRILQVNDALCRLTGFSAQELVGTGAPHPFWPPEATPEIEHNRQRVLRGEVGSFETTWMRRDGTRIAVAITSVAARAPDGEMLGYVHTVRDITEQRRHQAELERLASQDHLTGLLNHRLFHEHLQQEVARARRHGRPLSMALLDLDHFKAVNDRHGHLTGDRVLRETSRRLSALVRDGEHLARVGGEEFGWILPDAAGLGAFSAAERARNAIGKRPFPGVGSLTLSAGVCELGQAGDAEQLYRRADQALYWAKRHGRNRSFRYSADTARQLLSDLPPERE